MGGMGMYGNASEETNAVLGSAWARYWARFFDITFYTYPAAFLAGAAFPSFFANPIFAEPAGDLIVGILLLPLLMILDAMVIATTGTSLGKAIAGLSVRDLDGKNLSIELALKRNFLVYIKGYVFGIPILTMIGCISGYNAIKNNNMTSWDESTESRVYSSDEGKNRTFLIAIFAIALQLFVLTLLK